MPCIILCSAVYAVSHAAARRGGERESVLGVLAAHCSLAAGRDDASVTQAMKSCAFAIVKHFPSSSCEVVGHSFAQEAC